ncbi:protein of unknown function (plasmid) [Ralstonia solanacearum PSI07]|nr:protein of unknown function [Ralstonia solanacearum PSI07]
MASGADFGQDVDCMAGYLNLGGSWRWKYAKVATRSSTWCAAMSTTESVRQATPPSSRITRWAWNWDTPRQEHRRVPAGRRSRSPTLSAQFRFFITGQRRAGSIAPTAMR